MDVLTLTKNEYDLELQLSDQLGKNSEALLLSQLSDYLCKVGTEKLQQHASKLQSAIQFCLDLAAVVRFRICSTRCSARRSKLCRGEKKAKAAQALIQFIYCLFSMARSIIWQLGCKFLAMLGFDFWIFKLTRARFLICTCIAITVIPLTTANWRIFIVLLYWVNSKFGLLIRERATILSKLHISNDQIKFSCSCNKQLRIRLSAAQKLYTVSLFERGKQTWMKQVKTEGYWWFDGMKSVWQAR